MNLGSRVNARLHRLFLQQRPGKAFKDLVNNLLHRVGEFA